LSLISVFPLMSHMTPTYVIREPCTHLLESAINVAMLLLLLLVKAYTQKIISYAFAMC
jgi:hypothetical protein